MKLPALSLAEIPEQKILDYLLSEVHPLGMAKARFFQMHGFERRKWTLLGDALIEHARRVDISNMEKSRFGTKYVIKGRVSCPDGETPLICAVWIVATGETVPRLVTAYPIAGDE